MRERRFSRVIDRVRNGETADWLVVAVAASLPWSTSATVILIVLWLIAVLPKLDVASIQGEVMTAAGGLPVLLWARRHRMLWADVGRDERIQDLRRFHKLLLIPLLLAQFRRSGWAKRSILAFGLGAARRIEPDVLARAMGARKGRCGNSRQRLHRPERDFRDLRA
jgi:hypothetical protein